MNVESMLSWSPAVEQPTRNGLRLLRTAEATPAFWAIWRSDKDALKQLGITCKPSSGGAWEVLWWQDPKAPAATSIPVTGAQVAQIVTTTAASLLSAPVIAQAARVWSLEQQAIFRYAADGEGNAAVVARAGTGKTATAEEAIKRLPLSVESVLYVTFNKKNQKEAQLKIRDPRATILTWHALGLMLIKGVWGSDIRPDDAVEIERIATALGKDKLPEGVFASVKKLVGFAKNCCPGMPSVDDLVALAVDRDVLAEIEEANEEQPVWPAARIAQIVLKVLEASLVKDPQGRISFNDMIWLAVVLDLVVPSFDFVVVDECQDTNLVQLEIACRIVNRNGRVLVIGDDCQAIYAFRGAASDGLNYMIERLKAQRLSLTTTYRCAKSIVALAQKYVPDYRAHEANGEGIVDSTNAARLFETVKPGNAILSRSNAPLMPICLGLLREGIACRVEDKDVGQSLITIVNKLNAKSLPDFFVRLARWQQKQLTRATKTLKEDACEKKCSEINDQAETVKAIAESVTGVNQIVPKIKSLFTDSDKDFRPCVVCSTVHKAKGLEWDRVFILQGTFRQTEATEGEERNVYYVALTRARNHLTFVL